MTDKVVVAKALDVAEPLGPTRICVNCAGIANEIETISTDGRFPLDAFQKIIDVNLLSAFNVL